MAKFIEITIDGKPYVINTNEIESVSLTADGTAMLVRKYNDTLFPDETFSVIRMKLGLGGKSSSVTQYEKEW